MHPKKSGLTKLFKVLTILLMVCYLVSCCTPFISPTYCFIFTFLALAFPYLLGCMLLGSFVFLFIQKKISILLLLIIPFGYCNISCVFTISSHKINKEKRKGEVVKILSWNVNSFVEQRLGLDTVNNTRKKMFLYIQNTNAQIVCIQDNAFYQHQINYSNDVADLEKIGYKYHYLSDDFLYIKNSNCKAYYGTGIFSKYPILRSGKTDYLGHEYESIAFADVEINGKILRVFNTHLRSMNLHATLPEMNENMQLVVDDSEVIYHKSIAEKLVYFDRQHIKQAIVAKNLMNKTTTPYIFCADLNTVPSSYVYHLLTQNMNDVFLSKGNGFGKTYDTKLPTIRIDVMLISKGIEALSYENERLKLSDHFPIVSEVMIE